jgi:DNA-binding MarR family transcriptional regulator
MAKISPSKTKVTSLLHALFKLQQDVDSLLLEHAGVGLSAYRILSVLDNKVAYSQRHISVELGQTEANVSRQVRHMAEDNLVKIAPDKKDKRQRNITLTSKGQKKFTVAQKLLQKNEATILKQLK